MNRWLHVLLAFLLFLAASLAHSEKEHADALCAGFDAIEHSNFDGTRTDCLNAQYAVEVDFSSKWAEGIAQALYYGLIHDRSPGLILICSNYTSSRACTAHLGRAIETLEAYSLPGRLRFCEHDANSLDDCSVQFERSWQPSSSGVLDDGLVDQQAALGVN